MKLDHICFAVKNLEESVHYWKEVFDYGQMTVPVVNTRQKVRVVFLTKPDSLVVKLIEPCEDNASLIRFVAQGGGFHHVCFKCEDMGQTIGEMQQKEVMLLVPPQPGEAFENHDIAFFMAKNRLNFELIDTDEKAGKI